MNIKRNKKHLYSAMISGVLLIFLPAGVAQSEELPEQIQPLERNFKQHCGSARAQQAYGRALAAEYKLGNVSQGKYNKVLNEYRLLKKQCLESKYKYNAALAKWKSKNPSTSSGTNLLGEQAPAAVIKDKRNPLTIKRADGSVQTIYMRN